MADPKRANVVAEATARVPVVVAAKVAGGPEEVPLQLDTASAIAANAPRSRVNAPMRADCVAPARQRKHDHPTQNNECGYNWQIWRAQLAKSRDRWISHRLTACSSAAELLAGDAAADVEQMVLGVVQCVSDDGGRVDHLIFGVDSDHGLLFRCE